MLIKRPIYNQQLKCVAFEILTYRNLKINEELSNKLSELINNSDTQLPLFIPFAMKVLLEQFDPPVKNPVILKLPAEDIESVYSLTELENSVFSIALLINTPQQLAWLNFAEYIALTEQLMNQEDVSKVVQYSKAQQRKVIAYDIAHPGNFVKCKAMTMDYYCGDFIFQPMDIEQSEIAAKKLHLLQLIEKLQKENCDFNDITAIIQTDPLLSYQLLKIVNSIGFSGGPVIESIDQVIARLGLVNLKNWIMLFAMKNISDKPSEVLESGLIRARMAEKLAKTHSEISSQGAYTAGLLSILDCLLNKPMRELIESLDLAEEIKIALVSSKGSLGRLLAMVIAYEKGLWEEVPIQQYNGLDISKLYIDCLAQVSQNNQA